MSRSEMNDFVWKWGWGCENEIVPIERVDHKIPAIRLGTCLLRSVDAV